MLRWFQSIRQTNGSNPVTNHENVMANAQQNKAAAEYFDDDLSWSSLVKTETAATINSTESKSALVDSINLFVLNLFVSRHGGMHQAEDFPTHKRLVAILSQKLSFFSLFLSLFRSF